MEEAFKDTIFNNLSVATGALIAPRALYPNGSEYHRIRIQNHETQNASSGKAYPW